MAETTKTTAPAQSTAAPTGSHLLVGLDWGTNTSCLMASKAGQKELVTSEIIPTVVGYAKEGLLEGILPDDKTILFGQEALDYRLHLQLVQPMKNGVINNIKSSTDFARHLRSRMPVAKGEEIRAVIGVPARADSEARENMRTAVRGVFDKIILIPEPFLAALGYRDESKLGSDGYIDPVNNSLFVDIGGGSSDLCLVQGYYPQPEDQISIPFAGDAVDSALAREIQQKYPDSDLSMHRIREFKEAHSYVGEQPGEIVVNCVLQGKPRTLDIGAEVGRSCTELLELVFEGVRQEIAKANPDTVPELLQNIVITGGGSQIRAIGPVLQKMLEDDGYNKPKVRTVGADYKEFVARGAMKAAFAAKDRQWQNLIG